jgi:hypothetical protein
MTRRIALWVDVALKAALIGLLLLAVLFPDLPQFEGKAMTGRAIAYPLAALLVPAVWFLYGRKRRARYPYALDILLTLPFLIDVAGNALDLYDSIDWWDDANHFVNWGLLVAAFGQLLVLLPVGRVEAIGLMIGFGAVTAVLWEFAEYFTFIRNSPERDGVRGHSRGPRPRPQRLGRGGARHGVALAAPQRLLRTVGAEVFTARREAYTGNPKGSDHTERRFL